MNKIKIISNFIKDLEGFQKKELIKYNFKINNNKSIGIQYFNSLNKIIPVTKYNIYIAKEFKIPFKYEKIISEIIKKLELGININGYLSKNIFRSDYNDAMLNHFGIYHLHLGNGIKNGFRKRSGDLLHIYLKNNNIYILGIFPHKNWLEEGKIEIIANNWPETLKEYEMSKFLEIPNYSEKNNIKARKRNKAVLTQINGKVYMINLGVASSGDSVLVVKRSDELFSNVLNVEKKIKTNFKSYLSENDYREILKRMEYYKISTLNLKMILSPDRKNMYIYDIDNKIFKGTVPLIF